MTISSELIDKILSECDKPQELLKEGGFLKQLTKALIERCLEAEMDDHLGYDASWIGCLPTITGWC